MRRRLDRHDIMTRYLRIREKLRRQKEEDGTQTYSVYQPADSIDSFTDYSNNNSTSFSHVSRNAQCPVPCHTSRKLSAGGPGQHCDLAVIFTHQSKHQSQHLILNYNQTQRYLLIDKQRSRRHIIQLIMH